MNIVQGMNRWHREYACCTECEETGSPHHSFGKCERCYQRTYRQKRTEAMTGRPVVSRDDSMKVFLRRIRHLYSDDPFWRDVLPEKIREKLK